jgi:hypothetical protein
MPSPRKIDQLPGELKDRLRRALIERGFADIVGVTDELNDWLEDEGLELTVGKTAVGKFSKMLKDQADAFGLAETLMANSSIEREAEMHKALSHLTATSALQMIQTIRDADETLDPKSLAALAKMLKDLMASSGLREKLVEADRRAREAEQAAKLEAAVETGDIDETAARRAREIIFGAA